VGGQVLTESRDFGAYCRRVGDRHSMGGGDDRVLRRGRRGSELPLLRNLVVRFPVDVLKSLLRGVDVVGRRVQRLVVRVVKISLCLVQDGVGHVAAMRSIGESASGDLHEIGGHSA
jgi:hypothetical protein